MNTDRHSNLLLNGVETVETPPHDEKRRAMGSWKLTVSGSAIVCSSGVVAVQGKDGTADFSLRYEWLKSEIEKHPEQSEYTMQKYSPVTLANACKENKLEVLGKLELITKTVDVNYELKRDYSDPFNRNEPKNGRELLSRQYKSKPRNISLVKGV